MKKYLIYWAIVIATLGFVVYSAQAALFPNAGNNVTTIASSTAYAITTGTSVRLLASSSPQRVAVFIQPVDCLSPSSVIYLQSNDAAAVAATGIAVYASTTLALGDAAPLQYGAISAIAKAGTCTVLVTEWRSSF